MAAKKVVVKGRKKKVRKNIEKGQAAYQCNLQQHNSYIVRYFR